MNDLHNDFLFPNHANRPFSWKRQSANKKGLRIPSKQIKMYFHFEKEKCAVKVKLPSKAVVLLGSSS